MATGEPREYERRTQRVDESKWDEACAKLRKVLAPLPRDPDAADLREHFAVIRDARNKVSLTLARALPIQRRLRADLASCEAVIKAEGARLVYARTGFALCKNEMERKARLDSLLEGSHAVRLEIANDLLVLDQVVAFLRHLTQELRDAFEESSRSLASIELEYRIERSAP